MPLPAELVQRQLRPGRRPKKVVTNSTSRSPTQHSLLSGWISKFPRLPLPRCWEVFIESYPSEASRDWDLNLRIVEENVIHFAQVAPLEVECMGVSSTRIFSNHSKHLLSFAQKHLDGLFRTVSWGSRGRSRGSWGPSRGSPDGFRLPLPIFLEVFIEKLPFGGF